jgi:hypothetical protein
MVFLTTVGKTSSTKEDQEGNKMQRHWHNINLQVEAKYSHTWTRTSCNPCKYPTPNYLEIVVDVHQFFL